MREPRKPLFPAGGNLRRGARPTGESRSIFATLSRGLSTARNSTNSRSSMARRLICGFAHIWGYPVGIIANNGILFSETCAEGRALYRTVLPAQDFAFVFPAEHHRLHGRPASTRTKGIARNGAKMVTAVVPGESAEVHGDHWRLFRRGRANHGMCGRAFFAAFSVDVAERAYFGNGRRTGGVDAGPRSGATVSKAEAAHGGADEEEGLQTADSRAIRVIRAIRTMRARVFGTTAFSTRRKHATCSVSVCRLR